MTAGSVVGDVLEATLVVDLKRTQIVQYAGASGDFNPLHTDEPFATTVAGHPTVIAHGMLTMGVTGRLLTDHYGPDRIRCFGGRFTAPVLPGDTLRSTAIVVAIEGAIARLDVRTMTGDDAEVFVGYAEVEVGDR